MKHIDIAFARLNDFHSFKLSKVVQADSLSSQLCLRFYFIRDADCVSQTSNI